MRFMLVAVLAVATSVAIAAGSAAWAGPGPAPGPTQGSAELTFPAAELKWQALPGTPPGGPQFAWLWGDPKSGPGGAMLKLPAGFPGAMHLHTSEYRGIVVQGTVTNAQEGEAHPKALGPGSYWYQPAKGVHITRCAAGADCIFYTQFTGGFDAIPVTPPGQKAASGK